MKMRTSEALRRAYQRLSAEFLQRGPAVTLTQASILRALLENGPVNQRRIMEASGIDRSTMCETLRRLAASGLVVAVRLPEDKRATMVSITPAGRSALQKVNSMVAEAEAGMMKLVPPADRAPFLRALRALAEVL